MSDDRTTDPTAPPSSPTDEIPAPPPFRPDPDLIGDMERPEGPMEPEPRRPSDSSSRD